MLLNFFKVYDKNLYRSGLAVYTEINMKAGLKHVNYLNKRRSTMSKKHKAN